MNSSYGKNGKAYIIAELSANHNNDFELAKDTIAAMQSSGADAVKFQTYTADSLSLNVDNEFFGPRKDGLWKGRRLYELYQEASMPYEWQPKLAAYADSLGVDWLSSPFDLEAVDFLETIDCPAYKIASFEIQDIPLIRYSASKMKPMIMSTGIALPEDIKLAIDTCKEVGNDDVTILKCTSAYPTPFNQVNLRMIDYLRETYNVSVGLSDHTMGAEVALGAVALGASVIEKHFIMDRSLGGPDSSFSMEPAEFKQMVDSVRIVEEALGEKEYQLSEGALDSRTRGRSLFVVKDIKKGELFTSDNIKSIRPAAGLEPKYFDQVIGKEAKEDIIMGTPLKLELIVQ